MTMTDLLKACASGEMPRVKFTDAVGVRFGTVQVIKVQTAGKLEGNNGCYVLLDNENEERWFQNSDGDHKIRHHMRDLEIISEAEIIAKQQHELIRKILEQGLKNEEVKYEVNNYKKRITQDPKFIKVVL